MKSETSGRIHPGGGRGLYHGEPLFHQMAQGVILGMVLTKGNTAVLMPVPLVDAILKAIEKYRGTLFLGAPTLYRNDPGERPARFF